MNNNFLKLGTSQIFKLDDVKKIEKEIENTLPNETKLLAARKNKLKALKSLILKQEKLINYGWFNYSVAYLNAAYEILEGIEIPKKNGYLIPAFYLIRHSIELYLKFMRYLSFGTISKNRPQVMNKHAIPEIQRDLYPKLKKSLKQNKEAMIKRMERVNELFPDAYKKTSIETILYLIGWVHDFTAKYQDYNDIDNIDFRYPIDKHEKTFNRIDKFLSNFKKADLKTIIEELNQARIAFVSLVIIFDFKEEYINFNLIKKSAKSIEV